MGITLEKLHLLNKVDRLPNSTSAPAGGGNEDAPTLEDTLVDGHDDSPDDIAIQVRRSAQITLNTVSPLTQQCPFCAAIQRRVLNVACAR